MFRRNILPPSKGWRDGQWCREGQGQELRADQLQDHNNSPCLLLFILSPVTCLPISVTGRLFLYGFLFYPENGGGRFLRNADKLLPDYNTSVNVQEVSNLHTSYIDHQISFAFIKPIRVTILLASYILLVAYLAHFLPWRLRQYFPPKCLWIRLHS
jgi:hypothetical protein